MGQVRQRIWGWAVLYLLAPLLGVVGASVIFIVLAVGVTGLILFAAGYLTFSAALEWADL